MNINELIKDGGCKQVIFAITNFCNGSCQFCGFNQNNHFVRENLALNEGLKAIEHLAKNNVKIISLTGGEPLLNPHLEDFIKHCNAYSIICRTGTNGINLNEERIEKLKVAGLASMWLSIDSDDPQIHDLNRGKSGLFQHVCQMRAFGEKLGIEMGAGIAISKLIKNYGKLFSLLKDNGFKKATFAYPSTAMNSSYKATSDNIICQFTQQELSEIIDTIIQYKSSTDSVKVGNSFIALKLMYDHLTLHQNLPKCYAGEKIFYLDWKLHLYRCFTYKSYGHLFDVDLGNMDAPDCSACYSQCFRDYSLYYPVIKDENTTNSFLAWYEMINEQNMLGF